MAGFKAYIRAIKRRLTGRQEKIEPQLLMRYPHQIPPLVGKLEKGYLLRPYQEGDETSWMELLNTNGQLGVWDLERIRSALEGNLVEGSQLFIVAGAQIAALAGVQERKVFGVDSWEIGWVATQPEHQGKGLGGRVTAAAVEIALGLPLRPIVLRTDDYRIPAIKVYLKLGFVPTYDHLSYPDRWQAIFLALGENYARYHSALQQGATQ